eukprot:4010822-Pleurochrysis_carterae.AAC.1
MGRVALPGGDVRRGGRRAESAKGVRSSWARRLVDWHSNARAPTHAHMPLEAHASPHAHMILCSQRTEHRIMQNR